MVGLVGAVLAKKIIEVVLVCVCVGFTNLRARMRENIIRQAGTTAPHCKISETTITSDKLCNDTVQVG